MNKAELIELIRNDESSGVEFKRDDITPEKLANEMVALLNLEGGHILLGVERDQSVSGLTRDQSKAEEWVMEVARTHVQPAVIPYWEKINWDEGKVVGIVSLPADAPDKPYKAKRGAAWISKVRVGTETRDATREEEERLYQQSGRLQYGLKPVLGTALDTLDSRRLRDYLVRVLGGPAPSDNDADEWRTLLLNLDFATASNERTAATIDGTLLFGKNPKRFLSQSGIRAICYPGQDPDYATHADEDLRGPPGSARCSRWLAGRARAGRSSLGFRSGETRRLLLGLKVHGALTAGNSPRKSCAKSWSMLWFTATTA